MKVIGITIALAILIIIGVDIYLASTGGFEATFSWWMWTHSVQYPIIPYGIGLVQGILGGHFFWNQALNVTVKPGTSK
jgi:hypothetical protein